MSMIIDGTNGITFNNATVQASAGQVLQVVSASIGTPVFLSTNTWTSTGVTASITPKFSTSKILAFVSLNGLGKSSSDTWIMIRLIRGASTVVTSIEDSYARTASSVQTEAGSSMNFSDSPATTSSTTYTVQFASGANSSQVFINNYQNTNGNSVSAITLMEIAQ